MDEWLIDFDPIPFPTLSPSHLPSAINRSSGSRPSLETAPPDQFKEEYQRLRRAHLWEKLSAERWRAALLDERRSRTSNQGAAGVTGKSPADAIHRVEEGRLTSAVDPKAVTAAEPPLEKPQENTRSPNQEIPKASTIPTHTSSPASHQAHVSEQLNPPEVSVQSRVQNLLIQQLRADLRISETKSAAKSAQIKALESKLKQPEATSTSSSQDTKTRYKAPRTRTASTASQREVLASKHKPPPVPEVPTMSHEELMRLRTDVIWHQSALQQDRGRLNQLEKELKDLRRSFKAFKVDAGAQKLQ